MMTAEMKQAWISSVKSESAATMSLISDGSDQRQVTMVVIFHEKGDPEYQKLCLMHPPGKVTKMDVVASIKTLKVIVNDLAKLIGADPAYL